MVGNSLSAASVCAVVLAGGRASRMGGLDKGLQTFRGTPLAVHAVQRLQQQTGGAPGLVAINANRHLAEYRALGLPVWTDNLTHNLTHNVPSNLPDAVPEFAGPLAGFLCALRQCQSSHPYLLTVPCDSPLFPLDLLQRLGQSLLQSAPSYDIAMVSAPDATQPAASAIYPQPVFCLLRTTLADSLQNFLDSGGRKIGAWAASQRLCRVAFNQAGDSPRAFANANTLDDLHHLELP
ncbi:MAG: molybdenum cofactor guanylyltransferase [Rhodoferax sp.]|nr:molybdenum cofactor guanylyltransferase [Rhodoferax sp.]